METTQQAKEDLRNSCGFLCEVINEAVRLVCSCFLHRPASCSFVRKVTNVLNVIMNHSCGGTHDYCMCAIRKMRKWNRESLCVCSEKPHDTFSFRALMELENPTTWERNAYRDELNKVKVKDELNKEVQAIWQYRKWMENKTVHNT